MLDRFGQIEPRLFIAVDGYWYNGKPIKLVDKLKAIVPKLPTASRVVIGRRRASVSEVDLRLTGVVLERNGEVVATGAAAEGAAEEARGGGGERVGAAGEE